MGDGLSVSGGAGGVDAALTDIQVHARILRDCGTDLLALAGPIAATAVDNDVLAAAVVCPGTVPGVLAKIAAAELGPQGVLSRGAALAVVGSLTEAAVYTYEQVDALRAAALDRLQAELSYLAGLAAPFVVVGGAAVLLGAAVQNPVLAAQLAEYARSGQMGPDLLQFLYEHPEVTELLTGSAPGLLQGSLMSLTSLLGLAGPTALTILSGGNWPTTDYEDAVSGLIAPGGVGGLFQDTGDFVLDEDPTVSRPVPFGGISDIFTLQDLMDIGDPGGDPKALGQVRVIQVEKDGVVSLVVQVPGTEDWGLSRASNPVDFTTNVHAMTQSDTIMQRQVIEAIERARAAHPGAQVMLTGHSQGGIVAATIASDPDLVTRLGIKSLVTGGSPIGRMTIDPAVSVLSVEHTQDPVPMLDGTGNPDRSNWTTVRRDAPPDLATPEGASQPSAFQAHAATVYSNTGSQIDRSTDPALRAFMEKNGQFFGGEATSDIYLIRPTK